MNNIHLDIKYAIKDVLRHNVVCTSPWFEMEFIVYFGEKISNFEFYGSLNILEFQRIRD